MWLSRARNKHRQIKSHRERERSKETEIQGHRDSDSERWDWKIDNIWRQGDADRDRGRKTKVKEI